MSDSAYRGQAPVDVAPLTIRYSPFIWYKPIPLGILATGVVWVVQGDTGPKFLEHAICGAIFLLLLAAINFPIVTIRIEMRAGELIARGGRWPGADIVWTAAPHEVSGFGVQVDKGFRRLVLRTEDGRALPLTEQMWPGVSWFYPNLVARLDAWLSYARGRSEGN